VAEDGWIKIIIAGAQIVFAAVGWKIISLGNDKRETRKEVRTLFNEIRALTNQIEAKAFEYYLLEPNKSGECATQLKRLVKQLAALATTAARYSAKFDMSLEVATVRMKATGGDFESADRKPSGCNDLLFRELAAAVLELLDKCEAVFANCYPSRQR